MGVCTGGICQEKQDLREVRDWEGYSVVRGLRLRSLHGMGDGSMHGIPPGIDRPGERVLGGGEAKGSGGCAGCV